MRLALALGVLGVSGLAAACEDKAGGVSPTDTTTTAETTTTNETTTSSETTVTTPSETTVSETTVNEVVVTETTTGETNVAETTPGETTEDLGEGLCPGVAACVGGCTDQTCANNCVTSADNQAEGAAFVGLLKCLKDNACLPTTQTPTDEDYKKYFECQRTKCLDAYVTCYAGAEFGTGPCPAVGGCVQSCETDDYTCGRACFSAASKENSTAFMDLNMCVNAQCYKKEQTSAEYAGCVQQAQAQQPCSLLYNSCLGGVGAGPDSAGGGGGAGAREAADRAMKARAFFGE